MSRAIFPRLCPCLLGKPIGTHQWFFLLFQFLRDPAFLLQVQEYIPLQISGSFQGDVWKGCQFVHRTSNTGAVLKSLKLENVCIVLFCVRFEEQKVLFQKTLYSSFCALLSLERAASEESCEAKELEPTEAIGKWRANGWSYRARNQRVS